MIDSEEQNPTLAHHMTWIHNFPKCDSCVTINAAGRGRHAQEHHPFPLEAGRHYPVAMETGGSSQGLQSGPNFLPDIVRGRSVQRKQRFEINYKQHGSNDSQQLSDQMQLTNPNSSNLLPQISIRNRSKNNPSVKDQQRLAKSLDMEGHSKANVTRCASLPSLTSENLKSMKILNCSSSTLCTSASDSGVYDSTQHEDDETLLSRVSLEETDSEEEHQNLNLTIDPFPYQSERSPYESDVDIAPPKPPTPIKPKKKKKKEKPAPPPPPKPRPRKAKKTYQRKRPINFVALRRHEQEVARRHPIKKQFLYSNILESELQSYIPPRVPGGKLKPVYKRTQTGDIMIPHDPITVEYTELKNESDQDNVSPWQRRRQEALQAFLERRRKLLKRVSSNGKKKRVRFILPPGHVDSASEKESDNDDDEGKSDDGIDGDRTSGEKTDKLANDTSPGDAVHPPRVSIVVEEALRSLQTTPSRKDSDEFVQNWLHTTENESMNDHKSVERSSITDQFVKLPKIPENLAASPVDLENPARQQILTDASNTTMTENADIGNQF